MTTSDGCCEAMTIMEAAAARAEPWLQVCGPHDFGMHEYGCMCKIQACGCPSGDPRPVISSLLDDMRKLAEMASKGGI